MDASQFRAEVVRPVLVHLGLHSAAAENLLVGTALHESGGLRWLRQLGGGPAFGVYQIEPATHDDIWRNYLRFRPRLNEQVARLAASEPTRPEQLVTNLAYATAIARVHYLRVPAPLPDAGDLGGLARYWKRHFNPAKGAGTAAAFIDPYRHFHPDRD